MDEDSVIDCEGLRLALPEEEEKNDISVTTSLVPPVRRSERMYMSGIPSGSSNDGSTESEDNYQFTFASDELAGTSSILRKTPCSSTGLKRSRKVRTLGANPCPKVAWADESGKTLVKDVFNYDTSEAIVTEATERNSCKEECCVTVKVEGISSVCHKEHSDNQDHGNISIKKKFVPSKTEKEDVANADNTVMLVNNEVEMFTIQAAEMNTNTIDVETANSSSVANREDDSCRGMSDKLVEAVRRDYMMEISQAAIMAAASTCGGSQADSLRLQILLELAEKCLNGDLSSLLPAPVTSLSSRVTNMAEPAEGLIDIVSNTPEKESSRLLKEDPTKRSFSLLQPTEKIQNTSEQTLPHLLEEKSTATKVDHSTQNNFSHNGGYSLGSDVKFEEYMNGENEKAIDTDKNYCEEISKPKTASSDEIITEDVNVKMKEVDNSRVEQDFSNRSIGFTNPSRSQLAASFSSGASSRIMSEQQTVTIKEISNIDEETILVMNEINRQQEELEERLARVSVSDISQKDNKKVLIATKPHCSNVDISVMRNEMIEQIVPDNNQKIKEVSTPNFLNSLFKQTTQLKVRDKDNDKADTNVLSMQNIPKKIYIERDSAEISEEVKETVKINIFEMSVPSDVKREKIVYSDCMDFYTTEPHAEFENLYKVKTNIVSKTNNIKQLSNSLVKKVEKSPIKISQSDATTSTIPIIVTPKKTRAMKRESNSPLGKTELDTTDDELIIREMDGRTIRLVEDIPKKEKKKHTSRMLDALSSADETDASEFSHASASELVKTRVRACKSTKLTIKLPIKNREQEVLNNREKKSLKKEKKKDGLEDKKEKSTRAMRRRRVKISNDEKVRLEPIHGKNETAPVELTTEAEQKSTRRRRSSKGNEKDSSEVAKSDLQRKEKKTKREKKEKEMEPKMSAMDEFLAARDAMSTYDLPAMISSTPQAEFIPDGPTSKAAKRRDTRRLMKEIEEEEEMKRLKPPVIMIPLHTPPVKKRNNDIFDSEDEIKQKRRRIRRETNTVDEKVAKLECDAYTNFNPNVEEPVVLRPLHLNDPRIGLVEESIKRLQFAKDGTLETSEEGPLPFDADEEVRERLGPIINFVEKRRKLLTALRKLEENATNSIQNPFLIQAAFKCHPRTVHGHQRGSSLSYSAWSNVLGTRVPQCLVWTLPFRGLIHVEKKHLSDEDLMNYLNDGMKDHQLDIEIQTWLIQLVRSKLNLGPKPLFDDSCSWERAAAVHMQSSANNKISSETRKTNSKENGYAKPRTRGHENMVPSYDKRRYMRREKIKEDNIPIFPIEVPTSGMVKEEIDEDDYIMESFQQPLNGQDMMDLDMFDTTFALRQSVHVIAKEEVPDNNQKDEQYHKQPPTTSLDGNGIGSAMMFCAENFENLC